MKTLVTSREIKVPKGVQVFVKSRKVVVKGKRGTLTKNFQHLPVKLELTRGGRGVRAEMYFGNKKAVATIRTITSHIQNLMTGVTRGFQRKMRLVYAHFPINVSIEDNGKLVQLRNFLGEKVVREVRMFDGVTCRRSEDTKDELILDGNDVENVSQSAANIHMKCKVRNKDIRKFLDGAYTSAKGFIEEEEM